MKDNKKTVRPSTDSSDRITRPVYVPPKIACLKDTYQADVEGKRYKVTEAGMGQGLS